MIYKAKQIEDIWFLDWVGKDDNFGLRKGEQIGVVNQWEKHSRVKFHHNNNLIT